MTYRPGDFWRICDISGRKVRASETVKTWDGLIVHRDEYEARHPQDFVRGRKDRQNVPEPRIEPSVVHVGPTGGPWFLVEDAGGTRVYPDDDGAMFVVFGRSARTVTEADF